LDATEITYKTDLDGVDWDEMKAILIEDDFHNGRSTAQYKTSFENSYAICIAYADSKIIGTVRALSDGVCNAYIVDVWTYTPYRYRGIAKRMIKMVLEQLQGQHAYLWTDDMMAFYERIGFQKHESVGFAKVVGAWLVNDNNKE
jgi:predicted GNAT family acetyltransferase